MGGSPEMKTLNTGEKLLYEFGITIQMVNPHEDWMRDRDSRVSPTFSLIRVTGLGHESSSLNEKYNEPKCVQAKYRVTPLSSDTSTTDREILFSAFVL